MELKKKKAAIEGSKEVFFAIISTSIVLISIFIPVVFLKGDTAKLFEELAITIIGAIFFSTIVSLTLTPMLCSKILDVKKQNNNFFFREKYLKFLTNILNKKTLVISFFIFIIFFSSYLFNLVAKELAPREDRGAFFLVIESPEEVHMKKLLSKCFFWKKNCFTSMKIMKLIEFYLECPEAFSGAENYSDGIGIIVLNHWDQRRKIWDIINEIKIKSKDITDSKIIIFPPRGLGQRRSGSQLQFVISGDTYDEVDSNMNLITNELSNNSKFFYLQELITKNLDLKLKF